MNRQEALRELRKSTYVDMELKEDVGYPSDRKVNFKPAVKTSEKQIELYNLISEYVELAADYDKCESGSAMNMIKERMNYLKTRITHDFWVFDTMSSCMTKE